MAGSTRATKKPTPKRKAATKTAARKSKEPSEFIGGRGITPYTPEMLSIAKAMCKIGATDVDLAHEFGVSRLTIHNWTLRHPEFADALKIGKDAFDDRVERALAHRAVGYTFEEEKVFCYQGQIITHKVDTHVPPDVGAAKNWLINRRKDKWSETSKHELTGKDGEPLQLDNGNQIEQARLIAFAMHRALERREADVIEHNEAG